MIDLGIQWPRIQCSRAYAQHQHGMLQILCPTFPIIFSCVLELYPQHKCKYSCAPEPRAQHKTSHRSCASRSMPNTKNFINHVLQAPHLAQNIYIHIYYQQLAYAQYTKQIIMFICSGVFDPKIKHQYNHHDQQAHAYKWEVQNSRHYIYECYLGLTPIGIDHVTYLYLYLSFNTCCAQNYGCLNYVGFFFMACDSYNVLCKYLKVWFIMLVVLQCI